jgi:hypothetical protein
MPEHADVASVNPPITLSRLVSFAFFIEVYPSEAWCDDQCALGLPHTES